MDVLLDTRGRRRVKPLLLIYLFVLKAAANCPKPQGSGNTVLTNDALLMNDFPEEVEVTLECANGYIQESGSDIIRCIGGVWTEPDLNCRKKNCGPPRSQPNMSFNTSAGTLFGAVVTVVCDKGYQLSGSSYKQCYASGWSGRSRCEIVICDTPAEVTNGINSWDSINEPQYGEIVNYTCNDGYTLVGNDTIVCTETGKYNSQPPECKGVATEDVITTKMVTPTSTPPAQEASASTESPAPPTAHRDKTITTSVTPAVSSSPRGGRTILTPGNKATTASVTSTTSFQDKHWVAVEDVGYAPVIISVICVSVAVCITILFLHKFLLKRKGNVQLFKWNQAYLNQGICDPGGTCQQTVTVPL